MKYIIKLIIAAVPVVIVGVFYIETVRYSLGNLFFMGIFFMTFGVFVYSTKYARVKKNKPSKLDALIIGISQAFAVFPGVSRSGMTMGSGLILGINKDEAIKFSFLVAIPIIIGAAIYQAEEITLSNIAYSTLITSFTVTLLTSLLTIKLLIRVIKNNKFYLFGYYNFALGFILLVVSFFR